MPWAERAWNRAALAHGLTGLAVAAKLTRRDAAASVVPGPASDVSPTGFEAWLQHCSAQLGLRIEPVQARYPEVVAMLRDAAPALLRVATEDGEMFLLLLGSGSRTLRVLGPDLAMHTVPTAEVAQALCAGLSATLPSDLAGCVDQAGLPPARRDRALHGLIGECLRDVAIGGCWLLRTFRGAAWVTSSRRDGMLSRIVLFALIQIGLAMLNLAIWALIGTLAFSPVAAAAWLLPLGLAVAAMVLLHMGGQLVCGQAALAFGARLKQRLLAGALAAPIEVVGMDGVGRHLGRAIESDVFEGSFLNAAVATVAAVADLIVAGAAAAASGARYAIIIGLWAVLLALLAAAYLRGRSRWVDARVQLTHGLVERMVGHQTHLAQGHHPDIQAAEDAELAAYQETGRGMDPRLTWLSVMANQLWLPVGLAVLMPDFIWGNVGQVRLAVALGAVLLAQRAFIGFGNSYAVLCDAILSWRLIRSLAPAATAPEPFAPHGQSARRDRNAEPDEGSAEPDVSGGQPLLQAHDLSFGYPGRSGALLADCNLVVHRGDRILLEGLSGSGKSTLAAVLAGLRRPRDGLLLLDGLDIATLGPAIWQRRVALAPQFHSNHILTGTLAYNVLMGRTWPAGAGDLVQAVAVLQDLELGPLLERMPNGIHQIVGETGWQLSHGERSRIHLARALLQGADLLILDETFAALDPETLEICWRVLVKRQATMLVIAHP